MKVSFIVLLVVGVVGSVLLTRGRSPTPDEYMNREAAALRQLTVPADASVTNASGISRTEWSATMSWEFDVTQPAWREYCEWVKARMTPTYNFVPGKESETAAICFTKSFEGDSHHVRIESLNSGRPFRVRVTFQGCAN